MQEIQTVYAPIQYELWDCNKNVMLGKGDDKEYMLSVYEAMIEKYPSTWYALEACDGVEPVCIADNGGGSGPT